MKSKKQISVILDDGGCATLHVYADRYAHIYADMSQLADDLITLRDEGDTSYWDNNEWDTASDNATQSDCDFWGTPSQVIRAIKAHGREYGYNLTALQRDLIRS
jgi:hypothetical protein